MKNKIEKAISEYNKYHGMTAIARLVEITKAKFVVEFSGPFCYSCGYYDYFEDLRVELENLGIECSIAEVRKNGKIEVVFAI